MRGALDIEVARSPNEVFDFLADLRNEKTWNPRIVHIEKVTPGPLASGSTFQGTYHGIGNLTTELVDFDRPRGFSFRSRGPRMRIEGRFQLQSTARGTRILLSAELLPQGFLRLLSPLMAPLIQKQNVAAGERLRAVLEQTNEGSSAMPNTGASSLA